MSSEIITWSPGVSLENIEKQVILKAFRFYRGNKTQTAIGLGISVRTLDNKLESYEKEKAEYDQRTNEIRERELDFQRRSRGITAAQPNGYDGNTAALVAKNVEQKSAQKANGPESHVRSPEAGLHVEPAAQAPAQHAVSVRKPEKVQSLPPRKAGQNRKASGRR